MFEASSLNLKKYELLPINSCETDTICDILVKQEVQYLGIVVDKIKSITEANFSKVMHEVIQNNWFLRDVSIFGRILLSKSGDFTFNISLSFFI